MATIGVVCFLRQLRLAHFYFYLKEKGYGAKRSSKNSSSEKQKETDKKYWWKEYEKKAKKAKIKRLLNKLIYICVIMAVFLVIDIINLIIYPAEYHNVDPNKQELMDLFTVLE